MKPFNLERALAGDPVVTRDGRKVIDIYHFKFDKNNRSVAYQVENNQTIDWATTYGRNNGHLESEFDLFMAPVKRKYYMGISDGYSSCKFNRIIVSTNLYLDKEELQDFEDRPNFRIIEIEMEE